jgi:hypothetical protein
MDSNSFIAPHRQYYNISIVPTFWEKLNEFIKKGCIILIRQVYDEICVHDKEEDKDQLQKWIEDKFNCTFFDTFANLNIINNYRKIMNYIHANNKKYSQKALNVWANNKTADGWVIATAMINTNQYTVVSFESNRDNFNNPKIKNLANVFGVNCITLFEMMKKLGFVI